MENEDKVLGYSRFISVLAQNYLQVIPSRCWDEFGAGRLQSADHRRPTTPSGDRVTRILTKYLKPGGRLLCLFNAASRAINTGWEKILNNGGCR